MPKSKPRVLLIDDDLSTLEWSTILLVQEGYDVRSATTGRQSEQIFADWIPDVMVIDLRLPDGDGMDLLRRFKTAAPGSEVIILTGHANVSKAVEAMRAGAHMFIEKPVGPDTLVAVLQRAMEKARLQSENRQLRARLGSQLAAGQIIGQSRPMREALAVVGNVAASSANVLVYGESGTGKELIANAIHEGSHRANGPFVKINCAAVPKELIESELFGYKKGAFTGAVANKEGLFECADGGSLLLDEIGEMPPFLQTKLLRVLQEREYRPLGSDQVVRVDFRLICTTNVDVRAALKEGKLREDLYFRINTITIKTPSLRERMEDIPLLVEHFLAKFRERHQRPITRVAPDAYEAMRRYQWPGNIRELEGAIERAILLAKADEIAMTDLPDVIWQDEALNGEFVVPPNRTLAEIERIAIVQTLHRTGGNKQEAAQILGLYRPTLYSKMRKHQIGRANPQPQQVGPRRAASGVNRV